MRDCKFSNFTKISQCLLSPNNGLLCVPTANWTCGFRVIEVGVHPYS